MANLYKDKMQGNPAEHKHLSLPHQQEDSFLEEMAVHRMDHFSEDLLITYKQLLELFGISREEIDEMEDVEIE